MKKLLSLALVLCMLASLCAVFASCDEVSKKDVTKKPTEVLSEAMSNTYSDFFNDDLGISKVFNKLTDKNSVKVYFESDDLMGRDLTRIGATIYSDIKNQKYILEAEAKYKGDPLTALAYLDSKSVTVAGKSIFGNDNAYMLDFSTFTEKFKDSALAGMMDQATLDQLTTILDGFKSSISDSAAESQKQYIEMMDHVYSLLKQTVSEEEITIGDNKIKCVVVSYTIDNETLKAVVKYVLETTYEDLSTVESLYGQSFDEMLNEIDKSVTIDLDAKIYLNKKNNQMVKIALTGQIEELETDDVDDRDADPADKANITVDILFSADRIALNAEIKSEETYTIDLELKKETEGKNVSYILKADAGTGSTSMTIINASVKFAEDGKFTVNADVPADEAMMTRTEIALEGTYKTTKDSVAFEFTSLKFASATIRFKLGIEISANPEIPATPTDAKDVLDLTSAEWEALGQSIMDSDLGKIIAGSGSIIG